MSRRTTGFFETKRSWSRIKDRILASYLHPYLAHVNTFRRRILLIDAYAGPGVFEDGSPGSPLFMCQAAERYAKHNYTALFINKSGGDHTRLENVLREGGYSAHAHAVNGDSRRLLPNIATGLKDETVFLYLDPFGLCEFQTLVPFLQRNHNYSTEIVINLSMPVIHRLAGRRKVREGGMDEQLRTSRSELLTRVLGGDYWKEIMLTEHMDAKQREYRLVQGYMQRLAQNNYLTITGACPIQEARDGQTKYYMIFASRHPNTRKLFNDVMLNAYNDFMNQREMSETLFADLSWTDWRDTKELEQIVVDYVSKYPGRTRLELWHIILQDHFLRFTESEYRKSVSTLFNAGRIRTTTPRKTKKLNDQCVLYLV